MAIDVRLFGCHEAGTRNFTALGLPPTVLRCRSPCHQPQVTRVSPSSLSPPRTLGTLAHSALQEGELTTFPDLLPHSLHSDANPLYELTYP